MKKFVVLFCLYNTLSLSGMIATYKGVQAFNNNDLQTAQKHFDTVLTDNPHHAQTLYNLGKIAYKQEQFDQAQAYFEKALQDPDISDQLSEQAHYDNGTSYVKLQEWQKALEQFEKVIQKNPDHDYAKKMIEQLKKKIEEEREKEQQQQQDQDTNDTDQKNQQEEKSQSKDKSDNNDQSDSDTSQDKQNSENSDNSENNNEDSGTDEQKQESEEQENKKNESSDKQNQSQSNDNKKDQQNNQPSSDNKQDKQQQAASQQTQQAQQQENEKGDQEEKKPEQGALDQTSQQKNKEKIDVQTLLLQEAERNDAYCVKQLLQQQLKNETVHHGTKNW